MVIIVNRPRAGRPGIPCFDADSCLCLQLLNLTELRKVLSCSLILCFHAGSSGGSERTGRTREDQEAGWPHVRVRLCSQSAGEYRNTRTGVGVRPRVRQKTEKRTFSFVVTLHMRVEPFRARTQ